MIPFGFLLLKTANSKFKYYDMEVFIYLEHISKVPEESHDFI